jgi:putative transposase
MTHYPLVIESVVILPDHIHIIMKLPEHDGNFSIRWNMIKGIFSKQIQQTEAISAAREKKRERGIWQRRFWEHLIRDDLDYERHINYIHYNPVKHGYVSKPNDWPYSSIHKFIRNNVFSSQWGADNEFNTTAFGE